MDKIIYKSISLRCNAQKAFEMFIANQHLEKWLTKLADVEPKTGGKYELFWNPEDKNNDSTIGCKVLAIENGKFIAFEWKGPKQYKHFMNNAKPLTHVIVFFIPSAEGTEVHLLHTGWRDSLEWEEARQWFDNAWTNALEELQKYVNKA
jgi:uncharacterized protein YndB with AHSA1/START domain